VATTTDGALPGNTSEFSPPVPIAFEPGPSCGLGAEPAFLLPALGLVRRRMRRRR
jgi:hypothetical protein